jgi:hypothetical protein
MVTIGHGSGPRTISFEEFLSTSTFAPGELLLSVMVPFNKVVCRFTSVNQLVLLLFHAI